MSFSSALFGFISDWNKTGFQKIAELAESQPGSPQNTLAQPKYAQYRFQPHRHSY
ncbi:MAG: hypothetical protein V4541_14555 [Bacteroidota bacterium]